METEREIGLPGGGMVAAGPPADKPNGPMLDDVVRHVKVPEVMSRSMSLQDASLCRIADSLEAMVHDNMKAATDHRIAMNQLIDALSVLQMIVAASLVVQGCLLFVAAFR